MIAVLRPTKPSRLPGAMMAGSLWFLPWVRLEVLTRVVAFDVCLILSAIAMLVAFLTAKKGHAPFADQLILTLVALTCFAGIVSGLNAPAPEAYWTELAAWLYAGGILVLFRYAVSSEDTLRSLLSSFNGGVAACIYFSVTSALVELAGLTSPVNVFSDAEKLIGSFKQSNQLMAYLVLVIPLLWEAGKTENHLIPRVLYQVGVFLGFVGLFLTGSRTGAVAAPLILAYIALSELTDRQGKGIRLLCIAGLSAALLLIAIPLLGERFWVVNRALSGWDLEVSDDWRVNENWTLAMDLLQAHPLFGLGLGNVAALYGFEVHNTYLALLAETGIVGFLCFTGTVSCVLSEVLLRYAQLPSLFLARAARGMVGGVCLYLVVGSQHLLYRSRHFWVVLGLIWAVSHLGRRLSTTAQEPHAYGILAGSRLRLN